MRALAAATSTLDRTFAALADPTRRGVVELLRNEPHRAGELAAAFAMSPPAMSRHLRVLRKTGLVEESELDHDARVRVYRLRRERFTELRDWIAHVEKFWSDQLESFKAHAERTRGKKSTAARPRRRSHS